MTKDQRKLYITKGWVITIFLYYFCLFGLSLFVVIQVLMDNESNSLTVIRYFLGGDESEPTIFQRSILGSVFMSLSAASVAYIRKLYKLCFRYSTEQESDDQLFLKRLGTIVYFLMRPLIAMLFGTLIVIGIYSGMILTTIEREFGEGYLYISMFASFYGGFLSGEFIKKLESKGLNRLDGIT